MTHGELVAAAFRWVDKSLGYHLLAAEMVTYADETPDVIGWKGYESCMAECKARRSDFKADARKRHRRWGSVGNFRWFFTPPGLIQPEELPEGWGLAEWNGKKVSKVIPAPPRSLTNREHRQERMMLFSLARRLKLGKPPLPKPTTKERHTDE